MLNIILTVFLLLLVSVSEAQIDFNKPPPGGATVTFPENTAPGTVLYSLQATDSSGNAPSFSILNVLCMSLPSFIKPVLTINTIDQLLVPAEGLDAETCTQFIFTFSVTAGGLSTTSDPLTVIVTDVNDGPPQFSKLSYSGEVWRNDFQGQVVNENDVITAIDPDISNLSITFNVMGVQTTFAINSFGLVYVSDPSGLKTLDSSNVLTIQASDGGLTSTTRLIITVKDDPCSLTPCQNGGMCASVGAIFVCICLSGYTGIYCEQVDYCLINPCQNNGTCMNGNSGYTCICPVHFLTANCGDSSMLVFHRPPLGGATVTFPENVAPYTSLYTILTTDPRGIMPKFSLLSSECESKPLPSSMSTFTINNVDQLVVPAEGLDAEKCTQYRFTFNASAGGLAVASSPLTVVVTDVNDEAPRFIKTSYSGVVWKNDEEGQIVNAADIISATDPDITNLPIVLSIGGTQTVFAINNSGLVRVNISAKLEALISPTVLRIYASDGGLTSTATLIITVNGSPCSSTPCQNQGTCITTSRGDYVCSCLDGYMGSTCTPKVIFNQPSSEGATVTFAENTPAGTPLYGLLATHPGGYMPVFSVLNSTCESTAYPILVSPFPINNVDELIVPAEGLDGEMCTEYRFTFIVNANGSTAISGLLTVFVTDVNDEVVGVVSKSERDDETNMIIGFSVAGTCLLAILLALGFCLGPYGMKRWRQRQTSRDSELTDDRQETLEAPHQRQTYTPLYLISCPEHSYSTVVHTDNV